MSDGRNAQPATRAALPPLEVRIREAGHDDAAALALIGAATFLEAYAGFLPGDAIIDFCHTSHTVEANRALLAKPGPRAWLAEAEPGAAPVGYAVMLRQPEMPAELIAANDAELKRIYLFSRFYATGVGQRLFQSVLTAAQEAGAGRLLVGLHPENVRAMAFYRKQGFALIGQRRFTVGGCCFEDPVLALTL